MIKHLFKLIWNRKKRNFLLIIEIFLSFLVLFAIVSIVIAGFNNYFKPLGFAYEDVWQLNLNWYADAHENSNEVREHIKTIMKELENYEEVVDMTWTSSNTPYSGSTWTENFELNGKDARFYIFFADDNFQKVMNLELLAGRWFNREDDASDIRPVIINRAAQDEYFGGKNVVGEKFSDDDREFRIVGIIEDYRYKGEFNDPASSILKRNLLSDTTGQMVSRILIKTRPGTNIQFEETLFEDIQDIVPGWGLNIEQLIDKRESYFKERFIPITIFVIVAGFLVFNVALGLFGILWQSINRRKKEIGIRRAFGARAGDIAKLIWGESLVMSTFAIIIGSFLAIQVPILAVFGPMGIGVSLAAIAFSALIIYILVSVCALYPSRLASKIRPAVALHDE